MLTLNLYTHQTWILCASIRCTCKHMQYVKRVIELDEEREIGYYSRGRGRWSENNNGKVAGCNVV